MKIQQNKNTLRFQMTTKVDEIHFDGGRSLSLGPSPNEPNVFAHVAPWRVTIFRILNGNEKEIKSLI